MITSKGEPIFARVNMHGFRWKFMAPSSSRAWNSVMKIVNARAWKFCRVRTLLLMISLMLWFQCKNIRWRPPPGFFLSPVSRVSTVGQDTAFSPLPSGSSGQSPVRWSTPGLGSVVDSSLGTRFRQKRHHELSLCFSSGEHTSAGRDTQCVQVWVPSRRSQC